MTFELSKLSYDVVARVDLAFIWLSWLSVGHRFIPTRTLSSTHASLDDFIITTIYILHNSFGGMVIDVLQGI